VETAVCEGVDFGVELFEEAAEEVEEIVSAEDMVEDRLGIGNDFRVDTSHIDFCFCGPFGGTGGDTGAGSFSFAGLFRPTIHHSPEGLVCTSTDSVSAESISPATHRQC